MLLLLLLLFLLLLLLLPLLVKVQTSLRTSLLLFFLFHVTLKSRTALLVRPERTCIAANLVTSFPKTLMRPC